MPRKYPPGPTNWNAAFGLTWRHAWRLWWNPLGFIDDLRKYGDLSFFRLFGIKAYVANHPDLIRDVLITKRNCFRKLERDVRAVRQLTGNGIIVSEGDHWLRQRRMLQPAFHVSRMAGYGDAAVGQTERALERWQTETDLDVADEMTDLTLRIAAKTMFDLELGEKNQDLVESAKFLSQTFIQEIRALFTFPDWLPLPHKRRKRQAMEMYDKLIREIIRQRRASGKDQGDLLSMLLLAVDDQGDGRGMTDEQARDEAMTLFTAAFHANSMALTWTWFLLATHTDVEQRLLAEVDRVLGGVTPTYDHVSSLVFTQQVLKEAMRLYPPAWALFCRQAVQPVDLAGYRIEPGSWVFLFPYLTHRDARFFEEPERFDPERFSPARENQIPTHAYFPFGAGPRVCIGSSFAMMEMTLIVATIARRFRLALANGEQTIAVEPSLAIRPHGGLPMRLVPRVNVC